MPSKTVPRKENQSHMGAPEAVWLLSLQLLKISGEMGGLEASFPGGRKEGNRAPEREKAGQGLTPPSGLSCPGGASGAGDCQARAWSTSCQVPSH